MFNNNLFGAKNKKGQVAAGYNAIYQNDVPPSTPTASVSAPNTGQPAAKAPAPAPAPSQPIVTTAANDGVRPIPQQELIPAGEPVPEAPPPPRMDGNIALEAEFAPGMEPGAMLPGSGGGGDDGDIDAMVEDWLASQFGGPRDTSEEEALLRQAAEAMMGQNVVDSRARMGRMGFAASGAMGALEGDIRTQAAREMGQDIFDLRRDARAEELERARAAMDGLSGVQESARRDAHSEAIKKLIESMYPDDGDEPPPEDEMPETGGEALEAGIDYAKEADAWYQGLSPEDKAMVSVVPGGPIAWYLMHEQGLSPPQVKEMLGL